MFLIVVIISCFLEYDLKSLQVVSVGVGGCYIKVDKYISGD